MLGQVYIKKKMLFHQPNGKWTIRKWEHRMIRWMEAYRSGMTAKDAQFQVHAFSSRQYKSDVFQNGLPSILTNIGNLIGLCNVPI